MVLANAIADWPDPLSSFVIGEEAVWTGPGGEFLLPADPTMEECGVRKYRAAALEAMAEELGIRSRPTGQQ